MHRWRSVAVLAQAMFALGAAWPTARSQRVVSSLDVAGAGLWYADSIRATGSTLSPAISLDWSRATLAASGTASLLGNDGFSLQGAVAPSVFSPSAGPLSVELGGSLGGSTHRDGTHTGQTLATARAHLMGDAAGTWGGMGLGRTWDGALWRSVRVLEAGAWLEHTGTTALATASPVVVDDSIRYTDLQAAFRHQTSNLALGLTAGARTGQVSAALGGTARAWGSASLTAWLNPNIALVASAGSYPVDLTQGFPGGRFATLALRFAARSGPAPERATAPRVSGALARGAEETRASGMTAFLLESGTDIRRTIRIRVGPVQSVELSGDFTKWQPVKLTRGSDGWWSVILPIDAGTYQMNVRVNGGGWLVPPGLTAVADEFGATVGILTIE